MEKMFCRARIVRRIEDGSNGHLPRQFDRGHPVEQRFTFDQVASVYSNARPDYPDALVDDVVAYADLKPNDRILEVGCGTGQATKSFAKRGFPILATDPGSEMLRGARESLAGFSNVEFLQTTFEAWPTDRAAFRLIIAAQSWHWVSPEMRFRKAAEALSRDGSLAVFGQVPVGLPAPLLDQFKEIYLRQIGKWGPPPEAWYLPNGPFKGWFIASGLFEPVEHRRCFWKWRHTASSYVDFLRTKSDHRMMEPSKRDELLAEIAQAIDGHGGRFEVDYETHLYIARRSMRGPD
jgi:ubiquinone/menaquinone biosynthesis C-methylase UbiE